MVSVPVNGLIKNYGAVRAVNVLDIDVEDGAFLASKKMVKK